MKQPELSSIAEQLATMRDELRGSPGPHSRPVYSLMDGLQSLVVVCEPIVGKEDTGLQQLLALRKRCLADFEAGVCNAKATRETLLANTKAAMLTCRKPLQAEWDRASSEARGHHLAATQVKVVTKGKTSKLQDRGCLWLPVGSFIVAIMTSDSPSGLFVRWFLYMGLIVAIVAVLTYPDTLRLRRAEREAETKANEAKARYNEAMAREKVLRDKLHSFETHLLAFQSRV